MNSIFADKLEEFLDHECSDYGLHYSWEWIEDCEHVEVLIESDRCYSKSINFRFDKEKQLLSIELCEDSWYDVEYYETSVKYFWMAISPTIFQDNA